ncbi:nucleotide sugar dehydrogenase [Paraliobacillus zengyii]|uniref:nucleotide sugar dehydrogenase n=1 Tax=Paraliobacillus zengyii TaxID=2213194 RepID=UPI000E3EDBDF|nr:UDP binding domain-containing protein [Paraliobacillus zengyii]
MVENTQRDINIAFMNELAMLFDHIGINTNDVLAASRTKWNFHPFTPGLVGGHCISVDPYYLIEKAEQMGYSPTFMKEARKINAFMPRFVIDKIKHYSQQQQIELHQLSVNILGITFKENVPDLRNSKTFEIVKGLRNLGAHVTISDPHASGKEVMDIMGEPLIPFQSLPEAHINLLAVPHLAFKDQITHSYKKLFVNDQGLMIDLKGFLSPEKFPDTIEWWTL